MKRRIVVCIATVVLAASLPCAAAQDELDPPAAPATEIAAPPLEASAPAGTLVALASAGAIPYAALVVAAGPAPASRPLEVAALDSRIYGRQYGSHLVALVNRFRARNGLPLLEWASDLASIASSHSASMAARRRMSHDGFTRRFRQADSAVCVENLGAEFPHAEALLDGWRASPSHLRNLLDPTIRRVGVANASSFVTFFACR